jgi:long-chain fatty acid transport protein
MGANTLRSGCATLLASATVLMPMAAIEANAGAFGIREQSTVGQGDSFAGAAAGGALSSMFWNPATMTQTPGFGIEGNGTGIFANVDQHSLAGSTLLPLGFGGASDTDPPDLLFSGYSTWQINPNLWIGLSINSPFGLSTSFPDLWAGRNYALSTSLTTYNATPSVALRINEWLSVGLGAQVQFGRADLNLGLTPVPPTHLNLDGSGWGYGMTAGITVTPGPNTTIGIGWRSAVNQKIDGSLNVGAPIPSTAGPVNTTLDLPDIVSVGVRHRFDDRWTVMGTAEWTNWSRIGTSVVSQAAGGPALVGGSRVALPFQFRDGWFYSVGAEYVLDPKTTLRGGVAYEVTPITDQVRIPILPDNNRFWLSAGASYKMLPNFIMDVGYSHIWVKDSNINISPASGNPWFNPALPISYVGNASAGINIFSVGFRYMFNAPPPPVAPLMTKG